MADKAPPAPEVVTDILRLAIAAAGEMSDLPTWRGRMSALIPEIVATVSEGSREYRQVVDMMTAVVLSGEFLGYELQDRSHRCKVVIQADHSKKGEPEHVWSERTDTKLGAAQLQILKTLTKGCKVLVWKGTEQINDEQKVRMMYHIMRLDAVPQTSPPPQNDAVSSDSRQQEPRPHEATPAETSAKGTAPAAETPTGSGGPVGEQSNIPAPDHLEALERLSSQQRVAVIRWGKEQGILNVYTNDLTAEQIDSILVRCELEKAGMA